ncbi:Glu/Leu/Phe/Val dehydrogenase dimerization domain-containing protein [Georgenia sp. MJ173]|uniref:Glu/Leu/Phe/Val dehydrogenase dimerization domain-containing protein n=1 Tax=Georgenia sunbinii TaxID=3117728 RepID=UPI002F261CAA
MTTIHESRRSAGDVPVRHQAAAAPEVDRWPADDWPAEVRPADDQPAIADIRGGEPALRLSWTDPVTGATGHLVVHTLVSGLATGGTRMRAGCTQHEVEDLARAMSAKMAAFEIPVGGAKGGIDLDPRDPRATGVLERFYAAMAPWPDQHWVTAEDLGVTQEIIDDVFLRLGLDQSYHAAISRAPDPAAALRRVRAGLAATVPGGALLAEVIGGYGVAQACLGVADTWSWDVPATTVAVQGVGTMGGGASWYLHEAGMRVVALADVAGTLYRPEGLDVPSLLALRDDYGEIDRSRVPDGVRQLPRDAVMSLPADILVPAAVSYAINERNVADIAASVVVEAANAATTPEAEAALLARGVPVVPDFVVNAGGAAWAWWLLQGQVATDPEDTFGRLRTEMRPKIVHLLAAWDTAGTAPRQSAWELCGANLHALAGAPRIDIP